MMALSIYKPIEYIYIHTHTYILSFLRHFINLPSLQSRNTALTKSQSCSCQADKDVTSEMFQNQLSSPVLEAHVLLFCISFSVEHKDISNRSVGPYKNII